jgi:hypothetical protein
MLSGMIGERKREGDPHVSTTETDTGYGIELRRAHAGLHCASSKFGGPGVAAAPAATAATPDILLASYSGWFWSDNYLMVISRNGFSGNVPLAALNLPPGVTSEMPASVVVPKSGSVIDSIRLRASTTSALTSATVTLRGTSGALVRSSTLQFRVVDQLPRLPNYDTRVG